ncbi:MAG: MptD family putative ECF transporter S component [Clostridia bacterium]|nr:MptD family putative ECF transporter S component [Clostridia bacterium]
MKNSTTNTMRMKGKDLITVGIFSAIYFVINFAFMLLGTIPIMWILMPGLIALFTGIPYMLLAAKVQKPGAIFLMGLITGLIYFITGQFTTVILITFVIGCGLAELVRFLTKYKSFMGNTLSFACFSIGMIGSPLPIWLFKESFIAQISEQGMSADYVASIEALSSTGMLVLMIAAPIVLAFVGAFIAKVLFKKHFVKAGIV